MARWITLLLLLLAYASPLLPLAGQEAPPNARAHPVCTTCKGNGRAVLPCDVCGGDGSAPCVDCANTTLADFERRQLAILGGADARDAKEWEDANRRLAKAMTELRNFTWSFTAGSRPGCLPCPDGCVNGVSVHNRGHACKVCATKGFFKCKACQGKGEARCEVCTGKRTRELPCPECAGRGVAPDPLVRTADAATCAWCEDARLLDCRVCENGQLEQICLLCRGDGHNFCGKCSGTTKMRCNKCGGTGDLSSFFAAKASNDCDKCSKSGVLECSACKGGRVICAKCAGKGRTTHCPVCLSTGKALCGGCTLDSDLAWTTTGERLAAAGMGPAALAHFDVAISRVAARNDERVRDFEGTEKERKAFAKELAKDVAALKNRRSQLAKKLGL